MLTCRRTFLRRFTAAVPAVLLALLGPALGTPARGAVADGALGPGLALTAEHASALWTGVRADLGPTMAASRRLLLGSRDPRGGSCVRPEWGAMMATLATGGPGMRLGDLLARTIGERSSPTAELTWQQTVMRGALNDLLEHNQEVFPKVSRLSAQVATLADGLRECASWPDGLRPAQMPVLDSWPGFCARRLDEAVSRRDLAASQQWADETAAALFALEDLHRWLEYLLRNHLTALDFQARCTTLFKACDAFYTAETPYIPSQYAGRFPAGRLTERSMQNYLEVERQAEALMCVPAENLGRRLDGTRDMVRDGVSGAPAAVRMPPVLRGAFARLRSRLSTANQAVWDSAAHAPFDRSYLANILYRAQQSKSLDALGVVLERFDRLHPRATRSDLMDIIFYRAGDPDSGADWNDRFEPGLMETARALDGSDRDVLLEAQRLTRDFFGGWENYGPVPSLREALASRRLDCIRATDMIGALYRNAGRAGFYSVRWCGATSGHSVAAAETQRPGGTAIVLVDGLKDPQNAVETWPDAYVNGAKWPEGMAGATPEVYAVELYARGLDNYVWAEGYIIRGPDAGLLVTTPVPYLRQRTEAQTVRLRQASAQDQETPAPR